MTDTAIIGGGAAGLALAVMLKQSEPGISVTVLEASDRVGRKLAVTGNGRCNISNSVLSADRYHGGAEFAAKVLKDFGFDRQKAFFADLGVLFSVLEEGKVYPLSMQASSVVDALRFKADELGVKIVLKSPVTAVNRIDGGFAVTADGKTADYRTVAVACGGQAGGRLGSVDGYGILKSLGHKIERVFPSVVQIRTEPEVVRQLKGVKVVAKVTAESSAGVRTECGEVLFCDYGLSGPPVLQVSRLIDGENAVVILDILPDMSENEVKLEIMRRCKAFKARPAAELFTGFLHKRLGQVVLKCAGVNINSSCGEISESAVARAAHLLKNWSFRAVGTTGFENAQVTAGGAQTAQFFDNCMSKKAKGLFAVGEVLDVDGDCGGFNLAFAWGSTYAAANGIREYLSLC